MLPVRRRWVALVILLGVALHFPSLGLGLFSDDYAHELVLREPGLSSTMGPLSLYEFGAVPTPDSELWSMGVLPWWTEADWEVRFLRPLASLSRWLDSAVWGRSAWGMHLTGLLLFALLEGLVFALYRGLGLPPRAALAGLVLFACEDGAVLPVGWLAQRNTLLEVLFTVAALVVAMRGAVPGGGRSWVAALVLALCASLCKESGVVAFALLAVWIGWRHRIDPGVVDRARVRRALSMLAVPASLWLVILIAGDYGSTSAFYPEPWTDPASFLARALVLFPTAFIALVSPASLDALFMAPGAAPWAALAAAPVAVLGCAIVWRHVRGHPAAPFLFAWIPLALAPQCGAPISDRLLMGASIGCAGLLGLVLASGPRLGPPWRCPGRMLPLLVLFAAGSQAGSTVLRGLVLLDIADLARREVLEAEIGPPGDGPRDVLFLQFSSSLAGLSAGPTHRYETGDGEVRIWPLQFGRRALRWTRVDARTIDVTSLDEPFLVHPVERVFQTSSGAPEVGTTWRTAFLDVEAREVDSAGLRTVRVHAARDLDEPGVRFLAWRDGALRAVAPPRVGATAELPRAPEPFPLAP